MFSAPANNTSTQGITFRLVATPNVAGGIADADIARLPMPFAKDLVTFGQQPYGLRFSFGNASSGGFSEAFEFFVLEEYSSAVPLHAQLLPAVPIAVATSGVFTNPVGPTNMVVTGVGTSQFTWGDAPGGTTNGVQLLGTHITATTERSITLATLRYANGTITIPGADSVEMLLTLHFPDESFSTNVTFTLELIGTSNTNDARGNADIIRLIKPTPLPVVRMGGVNYEFWLGFGVSTTNGFSNVEEFAVLEAASADVELLGAFTRLTASAPTLLLSIIQQPSSTVLSWPTEIAGKYQLQASTNLPSFFPISGVLTGFASAIGFTDTNVLGATKFYRVMKLP